MDIRRNSRSGKVLEALYAFQRRPERREGDYSDNAANRHWEFFESRTGLDRFSLGTIMGRLEELGYATGPGSKTGTTMPSGLRPRDGLVWISAQGEQVVEDWDEPEPVLKVSIENQVRIAITQIGDMNLDAGTSEKLRSMIEAFEQEPDQESRFMRLREMVAFAADSLTTADGLVKVLMLITTLGGTLLR